MQCRQERKASLRVVAIYNADGGLSGELRYVRDKLAGRSDCALCDLTHGWNPVGKRSWRKACRSAPVPIETIHRDEATPSQLDAAGDLPAVLIGQGDSWMPAADAELIRSMRKNPVKLVNHLMKRLADQGD